MPEPEPDRFEREAAGWIRQEKKLREADLQNGRPEADYDLERIESNVIDVYRRLVRFPDRCPDCTRNGLDHDMECSMQNWMGPDRSTVPDN